MGWAGYPVAKQSVSLLLDVDDGDYHRGVFQLGENFRRNRGLECARSEFIDGGGRYARFDFRPETQQSGVIRSPTFGPIGISQPGAGEVDARLWSAAIDSASGGRAVAAGYSRRLSAGPHVAGGN